MDTNGKPNDEAQRPIRFLRLPEVKSRTGKSSSTIYAEIAAGKFPKPIKIGPNTSGWVESEVDDHLRHLIEKARAAQ
jgi:prophage regulatory protein